MDFSENVRKRGRGLVDGGRVSADAEHPDSVWWVEGSETYRVQMIEPDMLTCSCPHGRHVGVARCYHVAAALEFSRRLI